MDYKIALFIHVVCIATWFGGTALMAMYLRDAIRSNNVQTMEYALSKSHRWNLTMFIPTAVLATLAGVYMLLQYSGTKELWYIVKERFGLLFVLLFIFTISFYGPKLLKNLKENGIQSAQAQSILKKYIMILNLSLLFMAVLMLFVTLKIS
ncbi:hypothetical protein [Thermoflavimicrobium dichotomicum]|uniref:Copper resistance protein D n=1 Tax=Thermoflavimicrobium dichotomicum TaxID=46223 RepID=A0A1I3TT46_9BACL|nr:hypothetical protein [Thermoflavimicrobium dichotomicum]SFJ73802.1 hypothetical protein SAMN05421852_11962 [Thermoflavimicrobium dichotomicum]